MHKKITELGIGQTSIIPNRYKLIEYLPSMFVFKFLVQSKKPQAISPFDTLIGPYDKFCWYFIMASMISIFIALIIIQKSWMIANGEVSSSFWVYEGQTKCKII